MTGRTGIRAILERTLAKKELPAFFNFVCGCTLSVFLIGRLDLRAGYGEVIKDIVNLLVSEINPIGHALLFELGKQRNRGRIVFLDDFGGGMDKAPQPGRGTALGHAREVRPDVDALAESMAGGSEFFV